MKITFPSREFDEAVAAVCHDAVTEEQALALNEALKGDPAALDEYILRLELHSRLASEPELFDSVDAEFAKLPGFESIFPAQIPPQSASHGNVWRQRVSWALKIAACLALLAAGWWSLGLLRTPARVASTSKAVAMLNRTADAQWSTNGAMPRLSAPLEPGWLKLESGLAQIVFYSGARVVIEGPAELELISQNEARCIRGRIVADVPAQAHGFRVRTPQTTVTDLGTAFGLSVIPQRTELHVFKGSVQMQAGTNGVDQTVREGSAAALGNSGSLQMIKPNPPAFASLFDLQPRSVAAEAVRYDRWRSANEKLNNDPSLLVHFDLENTTPGRWQLRNSGNRGVMASEATIIGCQWAEGRWPGKRALEFQSVNDRVRLSVPGEFESLTLAAWVCVKGLDRQINSLFMCDGFAPGTVHWVIRSDGVLGLTVIDANSQRHQIVTSPPVIGLDVFGMWLHLAVVLDGRSKIVSHYVNGVQVDEKVLKMKSPFRISAAELGNWNPSGFPGNDPFLIRNFSGSMDEFFLFNRPLNAREIRGLYSAGKPQPDPFAQNRN